MPPHWSNEQGTQTVDQLVEDAENTIVITSLSVVEIASAFRRKHNRGDISEQQRDGLLVSFFEEATERYTVVPIDESIFEKAFNLVLEDDLRTLDALQLSAALTLPTPNPEITFVCADEKLVDIAEQHDFRRTIPSLRRAIDVHSYVHIEDCIDAMRHVSEHAEGPFATYNLGTRTTSVTCITDIVADEMGLDPDYEYTGGDRGWTGDVPKMRLSIETLAALGWEPTVSSDEAVRTATRELLEEL